MVGTLVGGCRCATSWFDLDLTFDLAVMTLTIKSCLGCSVWCRRLKLTLVRGCRSASWCDV